MTGFFVRFRLLTMVLALTAGVLVAAGSAEPTVGFSSPASAAVISDEPPAPVPAKVIKLHRTGGFVGVNDEFLVTDRSPGNQELFKLVESPEFRSLDRSYLPENECCDRFKYEVTVRYLDKTVKSVTTMDAAGAPEIVLVVIRLILEASRSWS